MSGDCNDDACAKINLSAMRGIVVMPPTPNASKKKRKKLVLNDFFLEQANMANLHNL